MSATAADVTNPDERQELLEQARSEAREEEQQEREALTLKQRVERNLESETVTLPVGGEAIEFQTMGREASEWVGVLTERLRRLDGDDYQEAFSEEVDRIYRELGALAEPDWMTQAWWEDYCSIRRGIQYLMSVNAEAEVTEDDIKNSQRATRASGRSR